MLRTDDGSGPVVSTDSYCVLLMDGFFTLHPPTGDGLLTRKVCEMLLDRRSDDDLLSCHSSTYYTLMVAAYERPTNYNFTVSVVSPYSSLAGLSCVIEYFLALVVTLPVYAVLVAVLCVVGCMIRRHHSMAGHITTAAEKEDVV